jgi:hypothetical protein
MTIQKQAVSLAETLVNLWDNYGQVSEAQSDLDMRDCCKELRKLDLREVDGVIASPLNYFVRAYLDDENPEDLTYGEMIESISISLGLLGV